MEQTLTLIITALILLGCNTVTTAAKPYLLKTCIVSENDLDSMGKLVRIVHNGQEIKFCCKPCIKKFKANPAKFLKRLEQ